MKHSRKRKVIDSLASPVPYSGPLAKRARVYRRRLIVELNDGRTLIIPFRLIPWFDSLPSRAFANLELHGGGYEIYFPAIDESVGVENLLLPPDEIRIPRIAPKLISRRPRVVHAPQEWATR